MLEVSINDNLVAVLCLLSGDEEDWKYGLATNGADYLVDFGLWQPDVLVHLSVLQVPRQARA